MPTCPYCNCTPTSISTGSKYFIVCRSAGTRDGKGCFNRVLSSGKPTLIEAEKDYEAGYQSHCAKAEVGG